MPTAGPRRRHKATSQIAFESVDSTANTVCGTDLCCRHRMKALLSRDLAEWSMQHASKIGGRQFDATTLFVFSLCLGLILYGFDLLTMGFSIDEEIDLYAPEPIRVWLRTGRWGTFILNYLLLPNPVTPVITQFIAIAFFAAAFVVVAHCWSKSIEWRHFVVVPFVMGFPIIPHIMSFQNLSYAVAIGFFLSSLAVWLIWQGHRLRYPLSVLLIAFSIAIYQPLLIYVLILLITTAAIRLEDIGISETVRKVAVTFGLIVASYVAWISVWLGLLAVVGVERRYVDDYVRLDVLMADPVQVVLTAYRSAFAILSGQSDIYLGDKGWATGAILLISVVMVVFKVLVDRRRSTVIAALLAATGVLVSLFISIIHFGDLPYRTLVGVPLALAGLIFFACQGQGKTLRIVLISLSAICFVNYATISNQQAFAQSLSIEADKNLVERIMERIAVLDGDKPKKLMFLGVFSLPPSQALPRVRSSTYGASFFEWDLGNYRRITMFLKMMSYDFEVVGGDERVKYAEAMREMPSWPSKGSIVIVGDMAVIKLSN